MNKRNSFLSILVFYVIALSLRYITNKTSILSNIDNEFLKTILQGIGPAIGALVAIKLFNFKILMTLKGDFNNIYFPFLFYWALPVILILIPVFLAKNSFPIGIVLTVLTYGLLEEIGWRGFLQQVLKPLPRISNILIVAVLWFIWHLNFEISVSNLFFFGILVIGSWGIGLIANKTNSLLAASAFHSLNNFYSELNIQKIIILAMLVTIWILTIVYFNKFKKKTISKSLSN